MTNNQINITEGSGNAVATETLSSKNYQLIKIVDGQVGSTSVLGVNPDRSINVSVIGVIKASVSGAVTAPPGSVMTVNQLAGSVLAVSGSFAPAANQSVSGAVTAPPGSVMTTNQLAGSVMAVTGTFTPAANQSVSGAVTAPPGSVMTVNQLAGSVMAVSGSFSPAGNQSVSGAITAPPGSVIAVRTDLASVITTQLPGSVMAVSAPQIGLQIVSVISVTPSSMLVGASIFGQLPAGTATIGAVTAPAGSIISTTNPAGSVTAVLGTFSTPAGSIQSTTNPAGSVTAVRTDNASVITTQPAGSVMAVNATQPAGSLMTVINPAGSVTGVRFDSASLIGTYAEDSAHTSADKGFFVLQVRNDTMSSITSTDGDYSPIAVGPVGEVIVAPAPINKWISAQTSIMYGVSVQAIATQGASVFTYVTGLQIANDSATFSRIKVTGGLGSVLAWTVAPANAGSNIVYNPPLRTGENSGVSVSISGVSSVYATLQGFSAKI